MGDFLIVIFNLLSLLSQVANANRGATPGKYWCESMENRNKLEKYAEDNFTIARRATLIQKRSGGLIPQGLSPCRSPGAKFPEELGGGYRGG
jgi:hypothetical protein